MDSVVAETPLPIHSVIRPEAQRVRDALVAQGLETPMLENHYSPEEKYRLIRSSFADIMTTLGLDLTDDSLQEIPHRIAKMYLHEVFSGNRIGMKLLPGGWM